MSNIKTPKQVLSSLLLGAAREAELWATNLFSIPSPIRRGMILLCRSIRRLSTAGGGKIGTGFRTIAFVGLG